MLYLPKKIFKIDYFELTENCNDYLRNRYNLQSQLERASVVSEWIEKDSNIADVGCGEGTVALYLKDKKITSNISCYDLPTENLKSVEDKGFKTYPIDLEDLEGANFPSRKFDYILLVDVLEHLTQPHKALRHLVTKAKKGLIVSFPNSGYLLYRLQLLMGIFPRQSFTHLHFWTYKDFKIFCDILGIEIADFKHEKYDDGIIPRFLYRYFRNLICQHLYFILRPKNKPQENEADIVR